jgi:hypothetical protein
LRLIFDNEKPLHTLRPTVSRNVARRNHFLSYYDQSRIPTLLKL